MWPRTLPKVTSMSTTRASDPHTRVVIGGDGELVTTGTIYPVEALRNGAIIKTPMNHAGLDCVGVLITDAKFYQRLSKHPRLVTIRSRNPEQHGTAMDFMPNGILKEYMEDHYEDISQQQRLR